MTFGVPLLVSGAAERGEAAGGAPGRGRRRRRGRVGALPCALPCPAGTDREGAAGAMGAVCVPALRDAGVKHTPKDVPDWKLGKTHFAGWLGFVLCFFFFPCGTPLVFLVLLFFSFSLDFKLRWHCCSDNSHI